MCKQLFFFPAVRLLDSLYIPGDQAADLGGGVGWGGGSQKRTTDCGGGTRLPGIVSHPGPSMNFGPLISVSEQESYSKKKEVKPTNL